MTKLSDLFINNEAKTAIRMLDYFDGDQEKYVEELLNDPQKGRRKWKERGIIPRYRNITANIVEKSGLLFSQNPPTLEVYDDTENVNEELTVNLQNLFDSSHWIENFINIDTSVRMLKTVVVLLQIHPITGKVLFDLLHRGNCAVNIDPITKDLKELVYRTSTSEKIETFRVYTETTIEDWESNKETREEFMVSSNPNPYNIIPAVVLHDTRFPRKGFWNYAGADLLQINEMYNLHITDSEYVASWSKLKQLFTNANIQNDEDTTETVSFYGEALPRQVNSTSGVVGGPGTVVQIETNGQTPFVQYLGPDIDLQPLDDVFDRWVKAYASDWSVNIKEGTGTATSGFQLVVEEIDNLQLRERRSKMMSAAFTRMYEIIKVILPDQFSAGELYITFAEPALPVDEKSKEEVWSIRIDGGRSSRIDYLMSELGLNREDATKKLEQIIEDNAMYEAETKTAVTEVTTGIVPTLDPMEIPGTEVGDILEQDSQSVSINN